METNLQTPDFVRRWGNVSTLPIRNGNTKELRHNSLHLTSSKSEYLTYKEWKPIICATGQQCILREYLTYKEWKRDGDVVVRSLHSIL